jgi:hypothetical protein
VLDTGWDDDDVSAGVILCRSFGSAFAVTFKDNYYFLRLVIMPWHNYARADHVFMDI